MSDESIDRSWIGEEYTTLLTVQEYGAGPSIDGVQTRTLRAFSDEGGDFMEVLRIAGDAAGIPGFRPLQINYSLMEPGTIKAWHLHRRQDDLWFVPPADRLLVGLVDVREASTTYRKNMRFVLGAGIPRLLFIPRGVAHGVANLSSSRASVFYLVNEVFNPDNPDEHRLPFDVVSADFWTIRPG